MTSYLDLLNFVLGVLSGVSSGVFVAAFMYGKGSKSVNGGLRHSFVSLGALLGFLGCCGPVSAICFQQLLWLKFLIIPISAAAAAVFFWACVWLSYFCGRLRERLPNAIDYATALGARFAERKKRLKCASE